MSPVPPPSLPRKNPLRSRSINPVLLRVYLERSEQIARYHKDALESSNSLLKLIMADAEGKAKADTLHTGTPTSGSREEKLLIRRILSHTPLRSSLAAQDSIARRNH